jgi:hypothetical protein
MPGRRRGENRPALVLSSHLRSSADALRIKPMRINLTKSTNNRTDCSLALCPRNSMYSGGGTRVFGCRLVCLVFCPCIKEFHRIRSAVLNLVSKKIGIWILFPSSAKSDWGRTLSCSIPDKSPHCLLSPRLILIPLRSPSDQLHVVALSRRSWETGGHQAVPKQAGHSQSRPFVPFTSVGGCSTFPSNLTPKVSVENSVGIAKLEDSENLGGLNHQWSQL